MNITMIDITELIQNLKILNKDYDESSVDKC